MGRSFAIDKSAAARQPINPVMIAKMKPMAASQSKSPASVPRLAEMSGSIGLYMIGLWSRYAGR